jgi:PKD repeat protein
MKHLLLSIFLTAMTIVGFSQEQCIYRVQPVDTEACVNDTAVFTAEVDTLFFESTFVFNWYYLLDGSSTWVKVQNASPFFVSNSGLTSMLKVSVGSTNTYQGCAFKCNVSDLYDSQNATLISVNQLPVIGFTFENDCFGDITHFNVVVGNDPAIESYSWNFSDGYDYVTGDVNHMFAAPGDYTVKLTGTDDKGCTGTFENTVTIKELPQPKILYSKNVFCSFESTVGFYAADTFATYHWEIQGANSLVTADMSEIIFNCDANFPTGQYQAKLTVSNENGCENTTGQNFLVLSSQAPVDGYVVRKDYNSNLLVLLIDGQGNSKFHWMKIRIADKVIVEEATTDKPYNLFDESEPINMEIYRYGVEVMPAQSDCSAVFYLK